MIASNKIIFWTDKLKKYLSITYIGVGCLIFVIIQLFKISIYFKRPMSINQILNIFCNFLNIVSGNSNLRGGPRLKFKVSRSDKIGF